MTYFGWRRRGAALAGAFVIGVLATGSAAALESYTITIKDHKFDPAAFEVPAGQRFQIIVINEDPTAEEFESNDFHVEKIVGGNSKIRVFAGPLQPGEYHYFGEFHEDTAQGILTVK